MKKSFLIVLALILVAFTATFALVGSEIGLVKAEESTPTVTYIETEGDFLDFLLKRYSALPGDKFILTSDIYLDRYYAEGKTIGTLGESKKTLFFNAEFDGRGHAIVGLKEPLFHSIGESGSVKNLQILGASVTDTLYAYPFAYENKGVIEGVEVSGTFIGTGASSALVHTNSNTISNTKTVYDFGSSVTGASALSIVENGSVTNSSYDESTWGTIGESASYVEINYALKNSLSLAIKGARNLYNTPFLGVDSDLNLATAQNGYPLYNVPKTYTYLENPTLSAGAETLPTATLPEGAGTKEDPYLISSVGELLYLPTLASTDYAYLTTDLDLTPYALESEYYLESLSAHLLGGGKTITLASGKSLINDVVGSGSAFDGENLDESLTISDLFLNGTLALTNNGGIYNVTALLSGEQSLINANQSLALALSLTAINGKAVNQNAGLLGYSRSYGALILNENLTDGGAFTLYSEGVLESDLATFNALNLGESVMLSAENNYYFSSDISEENIPNISTSNTGSEYLYNSNWTFGSAEILDVYAWAHLKGEKEDKPLLVFPSDKVAYKMVTRFNSPYLTYTDEYGQISGSGQKTLTAVSDESALVNYVKEESIANLYYDEDDYNVGYEFGSTPTFTTLNAYLLDAISFEIRDAITTPNWQNTLGESVTVDAIEQGEYSLLINDDYLYFRATLSVSEDLVCTANYEFVEKSSGERKIISNLGLTSLESVLEGLQIDQVSESDANFTHPLRKFVGVSLEILDENGNTISFIKEVGVYTIKVTVPSTENTSKTTIYCTYTRTAGRFDYSQYNLISAVGGLSEESAVVYDGNEIDLLSQLSFENLHYLNPTFSLVQIISLERYDGSFSAETLTATRDAGIYKLIIAIYQEGYEEVQKEITFYVGRKAYEVDLLIENMSSLSKEFLYELDGNVISYHTDLEDGIFESVKGDISYNTSYVRGSGVGDYQVSVAVPSSYTNVYNVSLTPRTGATITITPVDLSITGIPTMEREYNGEEQLATLDESVINLLENDDLTLRKFSVSYETAGFTNVGSHSTEATVTLLNADGSVNANYNTLTTTLSVTITPLQLILRARDSYVNYGEDATYQIEITSKNGILYAGDFYSEFVSGTHYTLTSDYKKGVSGAGTTLGITLTLIGLPNDNFSVSAEDIYNGTLTIGKKNYILNVKTSYVYTGSAVELDFNGETYAGEMTITYKSVKDNGVEVAFTGTPVNVLGDGYSTYRAYISVDESTYYYSANKVVDFQIAPKSDAISGLYLHSKTTDQYVALSSIQEITYDGKEYEITLKYAELTYSYQVLYTYSEYDEDSGEYVTKTSRVPIALKNATKLKDISITLTGNNNYLDYSSNVYATFNLNPKVLALASLAFKTYRGTAYTNDDLKVWVNDLAYLEGYEPVSGESVTFDAYFTDSKTPIDPSSYSFTVVALDTNYTMKNGGERSLTIVNGTAQIDLNEVLGVKEFEYGEIYRNGTDLPYIEVEIKYSLQEESTALVKLYISVSNAQESKIAPGLYDVHSIGSIYGSQVDENGDPLVYVAFTLVNNTDKILIKPLEISFDWANMLKPGDGIDSQYTYSGSTISYPTYVNQSMVYAVSDPDKNITENPNITIALSGERAFKHAGEYTFSALANYSLTNDDGESVYCYSIEESKREFTSTINKRLLTYEVAPVNLYVGESLPLTFDVTTSGATLTDQIVEAYTVVGFDNSSEGDYAVNVDFRVKDGGVLYDDYSVTKVNPDVKEISVRLRTFSGVSASDYTTDYAFMDIEVPVVGVPDGATVTYSQTPRNAGNYIIDITISKYGYAPLDFRVALTINKGTPYIQLGTKEIAFDVTHTLGNADVNAVVTYKGESVEGNFEFQKVLGQVPPMRYGERVYQVDFVPADTTNFNAVRGVSYTLTTTIDESDYQVTFDGLPLGDEIVGEGSATIVITLPNTLSGAVMLVVDGSACLDNECEFLESKEIVLVEVKVDDQALYSKTIKVTVNPLPVPPVEDEGDQPTEGDNEGTGENEGDNNLGDNTEVVKPQENEKESNLGLIVGVSVGAGVALIGAVVAVIIIIKKKKE